MKIIQCTPPLLSVLSEQQAREAGHPENLIGSPTYITTGSEELIFERRGKIESINISPGFPFYPSVPDLLLPKIVDRQNLIVSSLWHDALYVTKGGEREGHPAIELTLQSEPFTRKEADKLMRLVGEYLSYPKKDVNRAYFALQFLFKKRARKIWED